MISHLFHRGAPRSPFSVTFLLRGTREAYLAYTRQLIPTPQDTYLAFLGTVFHLGMEALATKHFQDSLFEERLKAWGITGKFDLYDPDTRTLIDYKLTGSYKVRDDAPSDSFVEWILQMNFYRLLLEDCGFPVRQLRIYAFVRDYGTWQSRKRTGAAVKELALPILPDSLVLRFFFWQKQRLSYYIRWRKLPPPLCLPFFTWGGNKCKKYCVARILCESLPREEDGDEVLRKLIDELTHHLTYAKVGMKTIV